MVLQPALFTAYDICIGITDTEKTEKDTYMINTRESDPLRVRVVTMVRLVLGMDRKRLTYQQCTHARRRAEAVAA